MVTLKNSHAAKMLCAFLVSLLVTGADATDTKSCCKKVVKADKVVTDMLCVKNNANFNGNVHIGGDLVVDGAFNKSLQAANTLQGIREALAFPDVPNAINWTQGVAYQIQVPGFFDGGGNPAHWGNLDGIIAQLDYLEDLGIEAIWLTQPTLGEAYWGFNTIDAKLIDPKKGTNEQLAQLVVAAHARNIKVIMGSVWHHTGVLHPFFQEALQGNQAYMDRYYFEVDPPQAFNVFFGNLWLSVKELFPDSPLAQQPENWYFRSKFGNDVADTNLNNPVMINWILDFSKFWIDKGIDGFRIDVSSASQISGLIDDTYVSGIDPNNNTNQKIIRALRQIKPDLYLVAEAAYAGLNADGSINPVEAGRSFEGGRTFGSSNNYQLISLFYDLATGVDVYGISHPNTKNNGAFFINQYIKNLLPYVSRYTDYTFVENHDRSRFLTLFTITEANQPVVSLIPPTCDVQPCYAPAPEGAFRIHYDASSLPPSLQDNNLNLYYFLYNGSGASNPFPGGSVNNLTPPPGNLELPFLGGGVDNYGPYWDFPLSYLDNSGSIDPVFGFIGIQSSGLVKVTDNINIDASMAALLISAGKGDVFVSGVPVPTTLPTAEQYNQAQTCYGLLLALPGSPTIWQGQEFGMQGIGDPSTREPLVWSEQGAQVTGFSPYVYSGIAPAGYENIFSTQFSVMPPTENNPLWVYMREAIHARAASPSLKQGTLELLALPGDPETDVVTIFDEGSDTVVTTSDLVAFTRSISNWPVYCIFNFGETPKQVQVRGGLLYSCDIEFLDNVANLPPQIYYSNNVVFSPVENPGCEPYIITMPQYSSIVFTPICFFGIPNGDQYQNLPACCI